MKAVPWVEKYRPRTVDEVTHQDEVVRALRTAVATGHLPHLLFYGPPGTGKTSTILAVAKQLFGPELFRRRILELNASDDRGLAIVREKIKQFAQVAVGYQEAGRGYPCPPFKIIILDEADSMTADAQAALRRVMEVYTPVTRFCLICNYPAQIIDPITSRCAQFRFQPVADAAHRARLEYIGAAEGLTIAPDVMATLLRVAEGDMRKSITFLQSAVQLYGAQVQARHVIELAGQVPPPLLDTLFAHMVHGPVDCVQQDVQGLLAEGYPVQQILLQLLDVVAESPVLNNLQKARMAEVLAETDKRLCDGCDEGLQLMYVATACAGIVAK